MNLWRAFKRLFRLRYRYDWRREQWNCLNCAKDCGPP